MTDPRPCRECGETIPAERPSSARYCSSRCGNAYRGKAFAISHPCRIAANRKVQNANAPARILARTKSRAKEEGIPFNLDLSDIVIPAVCPILGNQLVDRSGKGSGGNYDSPSVDRKVPSLGYVKGNVGIISRRANLLKSNITLPELMALVAYMEANDRGQ